MDVYTYQFQTYYELKNKFIIVKRLLLNSTRKIIKINIVKSLLVMLKKNVYLYYFVFAFAYVPENYYDAATGLSGSNLQVALHDIIKNHDVQSYSSIHDHFMTTDRKYDNSVWDMYSDNPMGTSSYTYYFTSENQCGNYSNEGDCYNREHSWPKSWFNNDSPMNSDLFHIYPTDGYVNSHRGNYPYGNVELPIWTSTNGSKKGLSSDSGYNGMVFEPIDEYKGDFARTYFYMSTRYYGEDTAWDETDMTYGANLKSWALNVMINWHLIDPVSEKEVNRNNAIYQIQANRNPFIDHPEWVECIWNEYCNLSNNIKKPVKKVEDIYIFERNNRHFIELNSARQNIAKIDIFDINGKIVKSVYSGEIQSGMNQFSFDSSLFPTGMYFCTIYQNKNIVSEKFMIIK